MKSGNNRSLNDIQYISALRGFAILLVLLEHYWLGLSNSFDITSDFLDAITKGYWDVGKLGVALMFLISGFLVPYGLKNKSLKMFLWGRFFRLYPVYWISIVIAILVYGIKSNAQVIANLTMFQVFMGQPDLLGIYWMLPIQWIFYIICIIEMKKIQNIPRINLIYYLMIFAAIGTSLLRHIMGHKYPTAIFILILIAFIGYYLRLYTEQIILKKELNLKIVIFVIAMLPICYLSYNINMGWNETWYRYFITYNSSIILWYIFYRVDIKNRFLVFSGMISYTVYLLHGEIYDVSLILFKDIFYDYWYVGIGIVLLLVYIVSYYVYLYVEKKITVFGKRFLN